MSFEADFQEEAKVEENPYQDTDEVQRSFSSTDSSKRSRRVIEFDENDEIIEPKYRKGSF